MSSYTDLPIEVSDRRKRGYFTIDNIIIDHYGEILTPYGIAVYACLARFANGNDQAWPSVATIAKRTKMSTRQVNRMINLLEDLKIIRITPRYDPETKEHKSNLYTLLDVVGGSDSQSEPSDTRSHRRKLKKKDLQPNNKKKEEHRNYRPPEYADIILG